MLEVEDRSLAMPRNSTLAEKTVVVQIQSRYRSSGVNHIALETSDIFALAKYLEQQGTEIMEVTGHYYDNPPLALAYQQDRSSSCVFTIFCMMKTNTSTSINTTPDYVSSPSVLNFYSEHGGVWSTKYSDPNDDAGS